MMPLIYYVNSVMSEEILVLYHVTVMKYTILVITTPEFIPVIQYQEHPSRYCWSCVASSTVLISP